MNIHHPTSHRIACIRITGLCISMHLHFMHHTSHLLAYAGTLDQCNGIDQLKFAEEKSCDLSGHPGSVWKH